MIKTKINLYHDDSISYDDLLDIINTALKDSEISYTSAFNELGEFELERIRDYSGYEVLGELRLKCNIV